MLPVNLESVVTNTVTLLPQSTSSALTVKLESALTTSNLINLALPSSVFQTLFETLLKLGLLLVNYHPNAYVSLAANGAYVIITLSPDLT